jgi:hypothetical protein
MHADTLLTAALLTAALLTAAPICPLYRVFRELQHLKTVLEEPEEISCASRNLASDFCSIPAHTQALNSLRMI